MMESMNTREEGGPGPEAYLSAIIASSDDAIVSKDLNGIIQTWNPAAERMFGYPAAEAIGQPITLIIPVERRAEEVDIIARLRRGERIDHFETVRVAKNGREVHISLSVSPIHDATGKVVGAAKIARDVTERHLAQQALAEQRQWFQTTLESIGDAVLATDVQGRVVFINAVAERLTGWRREDAEGRPCEDVFRIHHEVTREPAPNPVRRVIEEGVVLGLANHTVLVSSDGSERPIDDSAAPIRHPDGRLAGTVLVFRDVTERRRIELERRAAAADREELLESERAARAEAERASRLKDEFVAVVSHELRTPLNAMMGWAELMARDLTDAATRQRAVEVIRRNVRLQAQLVSDLLDVSRMLSGKLTLEVRSVDLATVIGEAVGSVVVAAQAKGVKVDTQLAQGVRPVLGDPARLQQIVANLLSNAIKFTPSGGGVEVRLRQVEGEAEITVADNGIGIRPEFLELVFERFRQGEASSSRRFGGLGLGLSIVKQLVQLHGGRVQAASDGEGRGATFTVTFPVEATSGARPDVEARRAAGTEVLLHGLSILVVEDDGDSRDLVAEVLRSRGALVSAAESAGEALAMLRAAKPDLIVSDIGLPGMDGYEFIERVRSLNAAEGGAVPAIALTAFARAEDRTRALLAGYQAHVAKPVEPAELLAHVASFTDLAPAYRNIPPLLGPGD
jgi:PAS domain S-box-containing protein